MLKKLVNYFKNFLERFRAKKEIFEDWLWDRRYNLNLKVTFLREKTEDFTDDIRFHIEEIIRKIARFFWYLDFLERFFDVIEHVCYYWIKLPYDKYSTHFNNVILPPIVEKYKIWRSKKNFTFRLYRRRKRAIILGFIKRKWSNEILFIERKLDRMADLFFIFFKFIFKARDFTYIKNKLNNLNNSKLANYIKNYLKELYLPIEPYVDEVIKDPEVRSYLVDFFFENGWAWYPGGLAFYQLAFLIYVIWLRYQFFYDGTFAYTEFYHQRISYVIHSRRALFENTEMWGNAYLTASFSTDSYFNCYYDKENRYRALHLFYDRYVLYPLQGYKAFNWPQQGSSVLHWGSLVHWQRGASYKTFNIASCFMERVLPDYYYKRISFPSVYGNPKPLNTEKYFPQERSYKLFKNNIINKVTNSYITPDELKIFVENKIIYDEWKWQFFTEKRKISAYGSFGLFEFLDDPSKHFNKNYKSYVKHFRDKIFAIHETNLTRNFVDLTHYQYNHSFDEYYWTAIDPRTRLIHFSLYDSYFTMLEKSSKLPFWFLNLNKDLTLILAYRNDFYSLFQNDYLGCALKNFFVFEQVFSYILNGLNEMTINEVVSRRYTSESFIDDWFISTLRSTLDYYWRKSIYRTCFWENVNYFNAPFWWRAHSITKSHFWDFRSHVGTYLWPLYYGETDTSFWALRNYFYAFAYGGRPYYYYLNLTHFFYREIFGHVWIFLTLLYWGFIHVFADLIHRGKEDRYYGTYKYTEIKELDYLMRAQLWFKSYKIVYIFLLFLITLYLVMDFYASKNTFASVYYPLFDIIKEFQEINDLYCDFNDYAYGEDFLMLSMSPEFSNYSDVSKHFLKDPYLLEEIDLHENSFKRRDLGFDYEFFMSDNYFFLRLYTAHSFSDSLFYKDWWVDELLPANYAEYYSDDWSYLYADDLASVDLIFHQKVKNTIKRMREIVSRFRIFTNSKSLTNISNLKDYFNSAYSLSFSDKPIPPVFNNKEFMEELDVVYKEMQAYYYLRKPNFSRQIIYSCPEFNYRKSWISFDYKNVMRSYNKLAEIKVIFLNTILTNEESKILTGLLSNNIYKAINSTLIKPIHDSFNINLIKQYEKKRFISHIRRFPVIFFLSYKYAPSEQYYYNFYLNDKTWYGSVWPFFNNEIKIDDFSISTKWSNIINPFSCTTSTFFPYLYFEEDWFQLLQRKVLNKGYDHFYESFRFTDNTIAESEAYIRKIERFQSFLRFPYIMAQRISKSHLYLEVISKLDKLDIENLQNVRLNHEASRTTFSKRYFKRLNKHFEIYFKAKWVYGSWDERALKLDNAISKFCHYYIRSGRYHNFNRMCLYNRGVKIFREIQWENREIPAPPNHMLEDALWYRFNVSFFKKGFGCRIVNPEWFIYSGFANKKLVRDKHNVAYLDSVPFLYFLKHTKDLVFYTFNPKEDIIQSAKSSINILKRSTSSFLINDTDPEFTTFEIFNEKLKLRKRAFLDPDQKYDYSNFRYYCFIKYFNIFKFDTRAFNYFRNNCIKNYNIHKKGFNLFQFIFCSYFGLFSNYLLNDYFINKNEILEDFELNLSICEILENDESRLHFFYVPNKINYYTFYPVRNFGFFKFDLRVKDTEKFDFSDSVELEHRNNTYFEEVSRLNNFFKIEEIAPSWSKIVITIEDIKNFHENYETLSWLEIIKLTRINGAYWFYFLYKSTVLILLFIYLLIFFNKIMILSIVAFRYHKKDNRFYKFGCYLYEQGVLNRIANNIYLYWFYWFIFFVFFQIFFWLDEFFVFIMWFFNSLPFVIDFIFY